MRLLYVTESVPNRDPVVGDGSSMIPFELLRTFPENVRVALLTFSGAVPLPSEVIDRCAEVTVVPTRNSRVALARSVMSPLGIGAAQRSTVRAISAVRRLSADNDVTLLHGPHVAFLARWVSGAVVAQVVDPWSMRLEMEAELASGWRRLYRAHKARQALSVERSLPEKVRLLTVGADDGHRWAARLGRDVTSIANGVQGFHRPVRQPGPPTVCFAGSLNYAPNVHSVRILVEEIAPQVWRHRPETRFVIAGRQPTPEVLALAGDRVEIRANVPVMSAVFHAADVAVFPDEYGLGIRNSVTEALAAGLPVVASPAAAREQKPHESLMVRARLEDQIAQTLDILAEATRTPRPAMRTSQTSSWNGVAEEYLAQLRAAQSHSGWLRDMTPTNNVVQ